MPEIVLPAQQAVIVGMMVTLTVTGEPALRHPLVWMPRNHPLVIPVRSCAPDANPSLNVTQKDSIVLGIQAPMNVMMFTRSSARRGNVRTVISVCAVASAPPAMLILILITSAPTLLSHHRATIQETFVCPVTPVTTAGFFLTANGKTIFVTVIGLILPIGI